MGYDEMLTCKLFLDERRVQNEEEAECQPICRHAETEKSEEHFQGQEEGEEE